MVKIPLAEADENVPLQQMITFRLSRLHAKLNAQAARILKQSAGISLSQWRIFVMVETHGKLSPAEIIRQTAFDKGQVSRTIKGMISEGLLTVETSESDQRVHLVDFTDKGLEVFELARPHMRKRQGVLMDSLTVAERRAIYKALDKLELAMEQVEDFE